MTENNYIVISSDGIGITADEYTKSELDALLEWSEECNGIKMKGENGCTMFTDDVDAIEHDVCMIIRGEIIVPEQRERELVITRSISEYAL